MIKAIIFDMDGVLLNSMPMHIEVWEEIFNKRNLEFNIKIFQKYNGTSTLDIAKKIIFEFGLNEEPETIVKEKHDKELELRDKVELFPETIMVLEMLRDEGYKIAVATSAMEHTVNDVKKRFKLDTYVDAFIEAKDVKNTKPSPDIFLLAAEKLGCEPEECVVVEDAVNGVIAANSAGMTSVAITNTFKMDSFIEADFIIDNLVQLKDVIKEMI